jgi:medium-chain acyl-[acyl-carrier-protein] hydrolase
VLKKSTMEQNGIWSEDVKIRAYMVDRYREANLFALQNLCQEAAGNHAQMRQLGYEDMQARGMAWVLNRLKIKVFQYPKWMETVTVKTWVSQMQPFSHRHFQVTLPISKTNKEELILANAYSIWIPIDIATKRPKRLPNEDLPLHNLDYDCEIPEKLPLVLASNSVANEGVIFSSERFVQSSDLDMLGHVNNAKYVEWLLDDFYSKNKNLKPKALEINYLGEVFENSVVQIFIQQLKDETIYVIKNKADDKEVCRAKFVM